MVRTRLPLIVFLCALPLAPARAWSTKEHIQLTRIAIERLVADPATPPAMKDWLRQSTPTLLDDAGEKDYFLHKHVGLIVRDADGIPCWSTIPDMVTLTEPKDRTVKPFDVHEGLLHYIDLEYFHSATGNPVYRPDLSTKPKAADVPRDMNDPRYKRAGLLPFAVEHAYNELVRCLRDGRLSDKAGQLPRDDHAAKWAGLLCLDPRPEDHHVVREDLQQQVAPA